MSYGLFLPRSGIYQRNSVVVMECGEQAPQLPREAAALPSRVRATWPTATLLTVTGISALFRVKAATKGPDSSTKVLKVARIAEFQRMEKEYSTMIRYRYCRGASIPRVVRDSFDSDVQFVWYVMQDCGTALQATTLLPMHELPRMVQTILCTLRCFHINHRVHGDVSCSNVTRRSLPDPGQDAPDAPHVGLQGTCVYTLIDFGNVATFSAAREWRRAVGTLPYMSRRAHDAAGYDMYDDIESLAFVAMRMLWGVLPWAEEAAPRAMRDKKREFVAACCSTPSSLPLPAAAATWCREVFTLTTERAQLLPEDVHAKLQAATAAWQCATSCATRAVGRRGEARPLDASPVHQAPCETSPPRKRARVASSKENAKKDVR